ncbi:membrane protein insertion efficiency factor YidD [Aldersonia kunmingensis]|uniref:membrane protein insertion efficiency factor YidD n=1 Tax=Aldersonia kunmingensis TaxID=408066 RepID=UPI00082B0C0C|nr:membrane protein insertion efficiency factor YidD [Aldersonia kunmingensis]
MSASSIVGSVRALPARIVIFTIELYRNFVSPLRLPTCRFTPTCSEYAVTALREFGLVRGLFLTVVRLAKCAPWHPGGWDPVPERKNRSQHGHTCAPQTSSGSLSVAGVNEQRST